MNRQGAAERRQGPVRRDQDESTFSVILAALLEATPLSQGAVLVDSLGEAVDYAGAVDPFDLKVAAAHFQIVMKEIREVKPLSNAMELTVRARGRAYMLRMLDAEYSLLLILHRHAASAVSRRALNETVTRICAEAGLDPVGVGHPWYRVEVETMQGNKRPARLRPIADYIGLRSSRQPPPPPLFGTNQPIYDPLRWNKVEVIGAVMGTGWRERGFRIRLDTGAEMTLIRERFGLWFVDEPP